MRREMKIETKIRKLEVLREDIIKESKKWKEKIQKLKEADER